MAALSPAERAAIDRIPRMQNAEGLRTLVRNARRMGSEAVARAAFQRLCAIQPAAEVGTLAHDVWTAIHALEEMRSAEAGKTIRLSRTRQKIGRVGERQCVVDLVASPKPSEGFRMLLDFGHPDLLFEAVVLRHPDQFEPDVLEAARARLAEYRIELGAAGDRRADPAGP